MRGTQKSGKCWRKKKAKEQNEETGDKWETFDIGEEEQHNKNTRLKSYNAHQRYIGEAPIKYH